MSSELGADSGVMLPVWGSAHPRWYYQDHAEPQVCLLAQAWDISEFEVSSELGYTDSDPQKLRVAESPSM